MAPTAGSPMTWTVRLKRGKSTTLLHVDPLQSFESMKEEMLRALHATHPSGLLDGSVRIPDDPADVILAKPRNIYDASQGWTRIEGVAADEDEDGAQKRKKKDPAFAESCPKAAGLKDGAVLAYKFRSDESEGGGGGMDLEDESWDVVIPSFEDGTGVVNESDVGALPHYRG